MWAPAASASGASVLQSSASPYRRHNPSAAFGPSGDSLPAYRQAVLASWRLVVLREQLVESISEPAVGLPACVAEELGGRLSLVSVYSGVMLPVSEDCHLASLARPLAGRLSSIVRPTHCYKVYLMILPIDRQS